MLIREKVTEEFSDAQTTLIKNKDSVMSSVQIKEK